MPGSLGMVEVMRDGGLGLFIRAHQPHDQEECHHGGDKVSVSHFPGATVVPVSRFLDFLDDDGLAFFVSHDYAALPPDLALLVALSTSSNDGRLWGGIFLRANSTQTLGEQSLAKARSADLITCK